MDREALAGRAAGGEDVTGADVRRIDAEIADAEATVTLLIDALPKAMTRAKSCIFVTFKAEAPVRSLAKQPFYDALDEAEANLKAATDARDRAKAEADHLPDAAQEKLEAVLDAHGRPVPNREAHRFLCDYDRAVSINEDRKSTGWPLVPLPWEVPA